MRQRLMQILKSDERDDHEDAALLRFWGRARPLGDRDARLQTPASVAPVIDLAQWKRGNRENRGTRALASRGSGPQT